MHPLCFWHCWGLADIGTAVAAASCYSAVFETAPYDSAANLGGQCGPSATDNRGLSDIGPAVMAIAYEYDGNSMTNLGGEWAPSSTGTEGLSDIGTLVTVATCDIAAVVAPSCDSAAAAAVAAGYSSIL